MSDRHLPTITAQLADATGDVCHGRSIALTRDQLGKLLATMRPGTQLHEGLAHMYRLLVEAEVDADEPRMSIGWFAAVPPVSEHPKITEDETR